MAPACTFGGLAFGTTFDSDRFYPDGSPTLTGYTFSFAQVGRAVTVTATPTGTAEYVTTLRPDDFAFAFASFYLNVWAPTTPLVGVYGTFGALSGWINYSDAIFGAAVHGSSWFGSVGGTTSITQTGSFLLSGGTTGNLLSGPIAGLGNPFHLTRSFDVDASAWTTDPSVVPLTAPIAGFRPPAAWSATFILASTTTPEPATILLLAAGLLALVVVKSLRRRR